MADFITISEIKNAESNIINSLNSKINNLQSNISLLIPKIITVGQANTIFSIYDSIDSTKFITNLKGNSVKYISLSNYYININLANSSNYLYVNMNSNVINYKIDNYQLPLKDANTGAQIINYYANITINIPSTVTEIYVNASARGG